MLTNSRHAVGQVYEETERQVTLSLAPIIDVLHASYGLFFAVEPGGIGEAFCHGVDPRYVSRLREAAEEGLLPPWLAGLAEGSVFDRAEFCSDQAFGRTAFFNHVVRPEGRFHCMIATPSVQRGRHFHLVIGRSQHEGGFDANDRRVLHAMLPHVGDVIRLKAEVSDLRIWAGRAQRFIDSLPVPMVLVAADASVALANREGRRALSLCDALGTDVGGRLTVGLPRDTADLRRAIAAVASSTTGEFRTLHLARGAGIAPIKVTVSRIGPAEQGEPEAVSAADVMVLIELPAPLTVADQAASVAQAFGLTRREAQLASLLARGHDLHSASRELTLSYNTTRSYLRQIFGKVDVHRQSDLIRLFTTGQCAMAGRVP